MSEDTFGFEKAIQLEHLTNEQIEILEKLFENYK